MMWQRWRVISMGYYDPSIERHVLGMTLEQAAEELDKRHLRETR